MSMYTLSYGPFVACKRAYMPLSQTLTGTLNTQVWIQPGAGLADDFVALTESLTSSSEVTILLILAIFAVAHSGLAGLRPVGEQHACMNTGVYLHHIKTLSSMKVLALRLSTYPWNTYACFAWHLSRLADM